MAEPESPLENDPSAAAKQTAAIFVGRVGSRELTQIKEVDYIAAPDGSIGLTSRQLGEIMLGLETDSILWLRVGQKNTQVPRSERVDKEEQKISFLDGHVVIDTNRLGLIIDGQPIHLQHKQFQLLEVLAKNRGRVMSREELVDELWGGFTGRRTVDVTVKHLRNAMGEYSVVIQTRHGVGYMMDDMGVVLPNPDSE